MRRREIIRPATLQDYTGSPEKLLPMIDEIAAKGYKYMGVFFFGEEPADFRRLCERAASLGLHVRVNTAFMKYQYKYLAEHPDQALTPAGKAAVDQDDLEMSSWGCPFHPQFKGRYLRLLREIAAFPAVLHIGVNDEAYLGAGCYCETCKQAYAREIGGPMPRKPDPQADDWRDPVWRRYLQWKFERWNKVHAEMTQAIHAVNPEAKAIFMASPICDMWMNPWAVGVDLAQIVHHVDGVLTDPYYTFHKRNFDPAEVYLSEWSRFLAGLVPEGKLAEIVPQGFSHPTFTRPLGEQDGYWSALVPPACGITVVRPYTYTLQKASPALQTYEACLAFDKYFEQTTPLKYAAVVHGMKTEVYQRPLPVLVPDSYDGTRFLPVSESLRHRGVPYGYLPDAALDNPGALSAYKAVIFPEIGCLSEAEEAGVRQFIESGGHAVILGPLGTADESGEPKARSLLEELLGVKVRSEPSEPRRFRLVKEHPAAGTLRLVDETAARRYVRGAMTPLWALTNCVDADVPPDAEIIAEFTDDQGRATGLPAIVSLRKDSSLLWFAGFPSRIIGNRIYRTQVRNVAHQFFAALVEEAAGGQPRLRVEGWPPIVPMDTLRPVDQRFVPTFEFFPLEGDDCWLGLVTSYFREPTRFPMAFDIPAGRELQRVTELISGGQVRFKARGRSARIEVELGFDTPALLYLFELR